MMYNNVISIVFLLPVMAFSGEWAVLRDNPILHDPQTSTPFWVAMTITGLFGFLINIAIFLQIKYTSPLTHNLAGTAKVSVHKKRGERQRERESRVLTELCRLVCKLLLVWLSFKMKSLPWYVRMRRKMMVVMMARTLVTQFIIIIICRMDLAFSWSSPVLSGTPTSDIR